MTSKHLCPECEMTLQGGGDPGEYDWACPECGWVGPVEATLPHVPGEFDTPIRCHGCGSFMSTDYDPAGLPYAGCHNRDCFVDGYDDVQLKRRGHWSSGGSGDNR